MQTKPIFIGFAAGILILVVAAASFSAGLYLGQRGYVADMQYQSPQGGIQNGGRPYGNLLPSAPQAGQSGPGGINPEAGNGPPGAPYWPPDVIGRIVLLSANSITLELQQGPVTIPVNASTSYLNEAGRGITFADLHAGDIIAVFGTDNSRTIMRLPPRQNTP